MDWGRYLLMNPDTEEERPEEVQAYEEVARRIRSARVSQNLTQDQLAERLGLKRAYIFQLERGNANPTLKTLLRLGLALGIDPRDFLPSKSAPPNPSHELANVLRMSQDLIKSITRHTTEHETRMAREIEGLRELHAQLDRLASHQGPPEEPPASPEGL
jgi:transcriptional regulator with XRE-family HTH domain